MIYFLTPNPPNPSGGVRKVYRQVDLLNEHDIPAIVVHGEAGYRPWWFSSTTPVCYWKNGQGIAFDARSDIIVVPEGTMQTWVKTAPNIPKVIYNQSAYVIWPEKEFRLVDDDLYRRPEVLGVMCVSDLARRYLEWAFPGVAVHRIRHAIDPVVFRPLPKKPIIAFMARRGGFESLHVINLARMHNTMNGFEVVAIQKQSEAQAAEILGRSAIFLSFGAMEGFGLPPAEAMACECVVVGYHGQAGKEYFLPGHSFPVETLNLMEFAQTLEQLLEMYRNDRSRFDAIGRAAGAFIRATYTIEQEAADILACWRGILSTAGHRNGR